MIELPERLIDNPQLSLEGSNGPDLLSRVLSQVKLQGGRVSLLQLPEGEEFVLSLENPFFCILRRGTFEHFEGTDLASEGEVMLFPHGPAGERLGVATSSCEVLLCQFTFDPHILRNMVCGLPAIIHIRKPEAGAWVEGIAAFLLAETLDAQPGASLMISRLIDLVVIRTLRTWVHRGDAVGWLGGLSDPRIAKVLKLIHSDPFSKLGLHGFARIAGMSRSSFCDHFQSLVGEAPLRYQNRRRIAAARELLQTGKPKVAEVALTIGYASEAAFSRAYKAHFGHSPANDLRTIMPVIGRGAVDVWVHEGG